MTKTIVQWTARILAVAFVFAFGAEAFAQAKGQIAAYLWVGDATAAQPPAAAYSFNAANKPNAVKKTGTGTYEVKLGGVGTAGGHAMAAAYGGGATHCKVVRWNAVGTDENVIVACFNGTATADTQFSLVFMN